PWCAGATVPGASSPAATSAIQGMAVDGRGADLASTSVHDVVVVGAGPAGWATAAACAEAGLDTAVLAPDLDRPWTPTYGAWPDELTGLGLPDGVWRRRWSEVEVIGR